jgi:hypothetical protein
MSLVWFCAQAFPRQEGLAVRGLEALGRLKVYLPVEPVWKGRGKERRKEYRPLLSRYLFVAFRAGENHFDAIEKTLGVARILRHGPGLPPAEVPWRVLAVVQTVEGELEDDFERRAAKAKRRYGDDTSEFIEKVKAAPPEKRAEQILSMLGRGAKARVKQGDLATLLQFA